MLSARGFWDRAGKRSTRLPLPPSHYTLGGRETCGAESTREPSAVVGVLMAADGLSIS